MALIIIILVVVIIIGIYIAMYNGLVQLRVHAQESWSQIDVQLQRRNDLIPNLVSTVKGYSKYEASTLAKVTELRTALNNVPDDDHAATNALCSVRKLSGLKGQYRISAVDGRIEQYGK